jgi:hypothetical protein
MPQLQKAIPVAVAPFRKFLRVVIRALPRRTEPSCSSFFIVRRDIAKQGAKGQSFLQGLQPVVWKRR